MPVSKILFVSHGAALGGSPISCYNLMKNLNRDKFTPVFVSGEQGPILERALSLGITSYVIDKKGWLGLGYIGGFYKILKKERIDLLHLNTLTSYYKYPALAAKLCGIPIVWLVREDPESKRGKRLFPWIKRLADIIVTVSYDTRDKMFPQAIPPNVRVVHNGIDLQEFRPRPNDFLRRKFNISAQVKLVGTISSLEERKGVEYLLRAVPLIKKHCTDFRLMVIGEDRSRRQNYLHKMQQIIEEEGIGPDVILTGALENIPAVMNSLDIFVLPSLWEGLARTLLEALACGKPIVATKAGGNPEQVENGVNGFLTPLKDPTGLAEAIISLLVNDEQRLKFGKAARKKAEGEFDLNNNVAQIENIYHQLSG
ncbi:MAG: glycosyltransferase family 4 protein [Candidatus Schekmanbacteria bacterium]|nr:glycosyltransferase family 4 protein [Candidatus Schekmanbacteria bacterium]